MTDEEKIEIQQIREMAKQILFLENIAKQKMSKEAIARYGNLKIAHHELAIKAITLIAQAVAAGKIKEEISDNEFKEFLMQIKEKKNFRFIR